MMTRVRKLAERIAKWVCRNAPPGAKDWGVASERELDHIENDWEALRWAAGSTTVLLARRRFGPPIASLEQVPTLAMCMERKVRLRTALCFTIVAFEAAMWLYWFPALQGRVLRTGVCLIVLAMSIFAVQAYRGRWHGIPIDAAPAAMVANLRRELVRQRQFHSGWWLAARVYGLMPGFAVFCLGIWIAQPTFWSGMAAIAIASAFAIAATQGTRHQLGVARAFDCQIEALDALRRAIED